MAKFSKNLTERFLNRGPSDGYCAICRNYRSLTADHVPPKNCGNISDSIFMDIYDHNRERPRRHVISQGGSHFKTICAYCNSTILGTNYDLALRDLVQQIEHYFTLSSNSRLLLPKSQHFDFQPNKFLRSIAGHLLAANAIPDVVDNERVAPLDAALREYVLDSTKNIPDKLSVYYWFYPHRRRVIMKHSLLGFLGDRGANIYGHVFKFFPLGFWFVWDEEEGSRIHQFNLRRMKDLSSEISATSQLMLDLSPLRSINFPESPPPNGMWMMADKYVSQAEDRKN